MTRAFARYALLIASIAAASPFLGACGGAESGGAKAPSGPAAPDLDGDPMALLSSGAIAAATIDVRALYDNHAVGAQVVQIAEGLLPLGSESNFTPSRDVERVTIAWYALTGADFLAVMRGHFDPAAIQRAADARSAGRGGSVLGATPYSGHTIYTLSNVGFSVLTPRTTLVGTSAALRLALDRIRDGRVRVELAPALAEALRTPDVAFAFAGEFASSPLAGIQGLPVPPWVAGVKGLRATGGFSEGALKVSGTVTFDDPQRAIAGADGMRQIGALVNAVAIAGVVPELKNLDVASDGSAVRASFRVDEAKLRSFLQQVPQWLPKPDPRPSPAGVTSGPPALGPH